MEILGIGASELIFILLIAIIVLGPEGMQKAGKTIGHWLNQTRESEWWKIVRDTSRDLRTLPNKWMREANLEVWEAGQDIRRNLDPRAKPPGSQRRPSLSLPEEPQNSIQPPPADSTEQISATNPADLAEKNE